MIEIFGITFLVSIGVGLGLHFILKALGSQHQVTWIEFSIVLLVITALITPLTLWIGADISKESKLTYNQFINGWEVKAEKTIRICQRDGLCRWTYSCDPYTVLVPYEVCTSTGKSTSCSTHYRTETHYHSCPYTIEEWNYGIYTTIGYYEIAMGRLPDNPATHAWRSSKGVSDTVIKDAGVGDPPFWWEAKHRIDSGYPGGATKRDTYKNWLYASGHTILRGYSDAIKEYLDLQLLPRPADSVNDYYLAEKVQFVGSTHSGAQSWNETVMRFNAAFGSELQGDLQLVIVQNERIDQDRDRYVLALKDYWQDPTRLGRDALAKNGLVVLLGTDGQRITWARAFTGMPLGNEGLIEAIQSTLPGTNMDPNVVVGQLSHTADVTIHGSGLLDRLVWGDGTRFQRVRMQSHDGGDAGGGFDYLDNDIALTGWDKFGMTLIILFFSGTLWLVTAVWGGRRDTV